MSVFDLFGLIAAIAVGLFALRYLVKKPTSVVLTYIQYFVGTLFIFSGAVKAIDPLGTSYKMHDYFSAFSAMGMAGLWDKLSDLSTPIAVFMIVFEIFCGVALLVGWKPKLTIWFLLLMTVFFTFLTGFTYLNGYNIKEYMSAGKPLVFNEKDMKVTDCGCFGDFLKLKPWVSFYKDIFLDVLIVILLVWRRKIDSIFTNITRNVVTWGLTALALLFSLYNFLGNEPIVDFRPYKIGNDINEMRKVKVPEKREFMFIYKNKKTNETKEFATAELTKLNFDEWDYVDRKDNIIDPGIPAVITNLFISNEEHEDITDTLLNNPNYSLMVVAYKLGKTSECCFGKHLNPLAEKADKAGIHFYCVTSGDIDIETFRHKNQTAYPFYTADETPLKTMIRSNPGLILLKNGIVINKWHHNHFPTFEELNQKYFSKK